MAVTMKTGVLRNSKMEKRFGNGQMSIPESVDEVMLQSVGHVSGGNLELLYS